MYKVEKFNLFLLSLSPTHTRVSFVINQSNIKKKKKFKIRTDAPFLQRVKETEFVTERKKNPYSKLIVVNARNQCCLDLVSSVSLSFASSSLMFIFISK